MRKSQNYDDDFQTQDAIKKYQSNGDQQAYENDFEQPSSKKIQKKNEKSPNIVSNKKPFSSTHTKSPSNIPKQSEARSPSMKKKALSTKIQSKYLYYLKTQFPHTKEEMQQYPSQKINRLNDRLRGYIQKVNDQLTQLINQNMRILKAGTSPNQSQNKTVEDQIKLLNQQKKNGQVYIQTIEKQCANLSSKWQQFTKDQVQLNTNMEIQQTSQKIKDLGKEIHQLKVNMHQQGNKLTEEKNFSQKINDLKGKLLTMRKQEQKMTEKLEKCNKNYEELESKNPQIQTRLQQLLLQAKRQNISLNFNNVDKKKQEKVQELKKKLQNQKLHKDKTVSLTQTKTTILKKDIDYLKNQINEIEKRFSVIDIQLHSTQQSSIHLIEESRYRDLQPYIQTHLDFIYNNIKEGNPLTTFNFKPSMSKERNTGHSNSKVGIKKYSSTANVKPYARSQSEAQLKPSFHLTKKIPIDLKNKQKGQLKLTQKTTEQRVWKSKGIESDQSQKGKQCDENNSKPFVIRKSQNVVSVQGQISNKELKPKQDSIQKKEQQKENQKSSVLGPKLKFKRTENAEKQKINDQSSLARKDSIITEKNTNTLKEEDKNDEDNNSKPHFKIKKAVKEKIDIPDQDLYLFPPATEKKIQKRDANTVAHKTQAQQTKKGEQSSTVSLTKGPNFKLSLHKQSLSKSSQHQPSKQEIADKNNEKNELRLSNAQKPVEEDSGINLGGRRQVQRKIQRKNQQIYAG